MLHSMINRFIVNIIPYLPISYVRMIAGRYVAGENQSEALQIVKELNNKGYSVTLDILALKEITDTLPKNATNIIPAFNKAADKLIVKYSVLENYDADIKTT